MSNSTDHTRRKVLSAIGGGSIALLAGCNAQDTDATESNSSENDESITPPDPSEPNVNEFPTVVEKQSVDQPLTEEFAIEFNRTPYQYTFSLEGYTHIARDEPSTEETVTFAEETADLRSNNPTDAVKELALRFSVDPEVPLTNVNYRFIIRVENQTTDSTKVLYDTTGQYFIEDPTDESEIYDGVYDIDEEFTDSEETLYRTQQYPWPVDTDPEYTQNEIVNFDEYREYDRDRQEPVTPYASGWGLRQNALTVSVTQSEFELGKQLLRQKFSNDTHPFATLKYTTEVDPEKWDHLDSSAESYTYDTTQTSPVRQIVSHVETIREESGVENHFSELSIVYNIINNLIKWAPNAFTDIEDSFTAVQLPEEFWRKGVGNCLDVTVNSAWILSELGYEVAPEYVGDDHACCAVKLPRSVIKSDFPTTLYMHMENDQNNRGYPEEDGEYRWVHFDPTLQDFGATLNRDSYRVFKQATLEGTDKNL